MRAENIGIIIIITTIAFLMGAYAEYAPRQIGIDNFKDCYERTQDINWCCDKFLK